MKIPITREEALLLGILGKAMGGFANLPDVTQAEVDAFVLPCIKAQSLIVQRVNKRSIPTSE